MEKLEKKRQKTNLACNISPDNVQENSAISFFFDLADAIDLKQALFGLGPSGAA